MTCLRMPLLVAAALLAPVGCGGVGADGPRSPDGGADASGDGSSATDGSLAALSCDELLAELIAETVDRSACSSAAECGDGIYPCQAGTPAVRLGEDPTRLRQLYDAYLGRCIDGGGPSLPACSEVKCEEVMSKLAPPGTAICIQY